MHNTGAAVDQQILAAILLLEPVDFGRVRELLKQPPHAKNYLNRPSKLDPYKAYLHQRFFEEDCHSALTLWQELVEQGYSGGRSYLTQYVGQLRKHLKQVEEGKIETEKVVSHKPGTVVSHNLYSPGKVFWWFILPKQRLRESQRRKLAILCTGNPLLALTYQLAQGFQRLYWERQSAGLVGWLKKAEEGPIDQWKSFAGGVKRDETAITASIAMKWTNAYTRKFRNPRIVPLKFFYYFSLDCSIGNLTSNIS